jgi:hypothetical protein
MGQGAGMNKRHPINITIVMSTSYQISHRSGVPFSCPIFINGTHGTYATPCHSIGLRGSHRD